MVWSRKCSHRNAPCSENQRPKRQGWVGNRDDRTKAQDYGAMPSVSYETARRQIRLTDKGRAGYAERCKSGSRGGCSETYRSNAARRRVPTLLYAAMLASWWSCICLLIVMVQWQVYTVPSESQHLAFPHPSKESHNI